MRKLIAALLFGAMTAAAPAANVEFTYNPDPQNPDCRAFGFQKKETYDIAIHLVDPTLTGATVKSMRVPIPAKEEWLKDISGWLSTELRLENKANVPDITSQPASVADQMLTVTFDVPYTIPEEGVYVGYSFTVVELADYSTMPVTYVEGSVPGSLYVHSSRTRLKWTDETLSHDYVSPMVVTVETDSSDTDVAASLPAESYAVVSEKCALPLTLVNYGTQPLADITYTWSAGEDSGSGSFSLPAPLAPGERATVSVEAGPLAEMGQYPLSLTVETFNGAANSDPRRTATTPMVVMPFMPVNRPLVEEYTGLRCGYCPRGYVAMEQMAEDYGDRFVGLAYHTETYETGCMVVMPNSAFPMSVSGFPSGSLNRQRELDPADIPPIWQSAADIVAPADVDVALTWADDAHTALRATASLRFAREYDDADMNIAIAIIANGLSNPRWVQSNYFSGSDEVSGPLWEPFVNGGSIVPGLTFNDVVVKFDDVHGIDGSVPAVISFDDRPELSVTVPLDGLVNLSGEQFISDGASLQAVGILIDNATGTPLNSNKSVPLTFETVGVGAIDTATAVLSTEWYDMQGVRVSAPAPGDMLIRLDRLSDGTLRHTKAIVR